MQGGAETMELIAPPSRGTDTPTSAETVRMTLRGHHRLVTERLRDVLAPYADRAVVTHLADPGEIELTLELPADELGGALTRLQQGPVEPEAALTAREREVLALVAEGLSNQEIAARLYVTGNTLKSYIRSAYRKVGVRTRAQAVRWMYEHASAAG
jgi:DNA-binding CsgD family transcriptional regulator